MSTCIENNMIYMYADVWLRCLRQYPRIYSFSEKPGPNQPPGIRTDENVKSICVEDLTQLMQTNRLMVAKQLCTENKTRNIQKLLDQLQGFVMIENEHPSAFTETKYKFTGKVNGGRDDVVMSLMLDIFHCNLARGSPEFIEYCNFHQITP